MKRLWIAAAIALPSLALGACATGYGEVYAGGPYGYDGYYDDFYGPIYDGYWGSDGFFYYRSGHGDRHFRRGDTSHFVRGNAQPGGHFHEMHGSFTPDRGMRMPHFNGGPRGHGRDH
jgi:hypothetical protein